MPFCICKITSILMSLWRLQVKNLGGGVVDNSTLIIHWPYEIERGQPEGKTLLYLMEHPKVWCGLRLHLRLFRLVKAVYILISSKLQKLVNSFNFLLYSWVPVRIWIIVLHIVYHCHVYIYIFTEDEAWINVGRSDYCCLFVIFSLRVRLNVFQKKNISTDLT